MVINIKRVSGKEKMTVDIVCILLSVTNCLRKIKKI